MYDYNSNRGSKCGECKVGKTRTIDIERKKLKKKKSIPNIGLVFKIPSTLYIYIYMVFLRLVLVGKERKKVVSK